MVVQMILQAAGKQGKGLSGHGNLPRASMAEAFGEAFAGGGGDFLRKCGPQPCRDG